VGVRLLPVDGTRSDEFGDVPVYRGVSYCDAVRRAGEGEALLVLPGSLQVCGWAPVVLGLKETAGRFEEGLEPRLAFTSGGLLLAPLERISGEPDLVLVRAAPELLQEMVRALDPDDLWGEHGGRLDRSALSLFDPTPSSPGKKRAGGRATFIAATNRVLASLARSRRWQGLTRWLFRSRLVTAGFDALISRAMADMSVCRNSTVIPLLSDRANLSFYCTGGITWGRNCPDHLTSGWPWDLFQQAIQAASNPNQGPDSGGAP
jgi:uncharacterized protein (DUF169 family)